MSSRLALVPLSWKEVSWKETAADLHIEVKQGSSLMPKVSSTHEDGFDAEDVMEWAWVSSLDFVEILIESDVDEVDPPMTCEVEVGSLLKGS